jgi:hypothetical protein
MCSGCNTTFTLRGYHSHISQTHDSLCRAAFDRLKKSYETYQLVLDQAANSSDEAVENSDRDINMDVELDPAIDEHDDSESESDLEDIVADLEMGWEPPREGAPQEDASGDHGDEPDDIVRLPVPASESSLDEEKADSDIESTQGNFDRYIIGDGYGVKPAARMLYTDKYPSSLAGKTLSREESRDCLYDVSVGGGDNPWAPFRSKKDWEIARWAKFRGVGSTAFSEILAIDGVRLFLQSSLAAKLRI